MHVDMAASNGELMRLLIIYKFHQLIISPKHTVEKKYAQQSLNGHIDTSSTTSIFEAVILHLARRIRNSVENRK